MKRSEAKKLGLVKYNTGKPCRHGHMSDKFTSSGSCVECIKNRAQAKTLSAGDIAKLFTYNENNGDLTFKSTGSLVRSITGANNKYTSYYRANVNGRHYLAHRIAWAIAYGEYPKGVIDHIDGNGLSNQLLNLRDVTARQNISNCRISSNNKTGVNGVWMQQGRFVAEIMVNRKKISLGSYSTLEDAAKARADANIKYGFHKLHGTIKH